MDYPDKPGNDIVGLKAIHTDLERVKGIEPSS